MLVEEIMTKGVVSIGPEMPIGDAYILMEQRNIRHFPVLEVVHTEQAVISNEVESDAKLVGIVSDRDIRAVGSELPNAKKDVTLKDLVRRIMVSPVLTAHPLDPIEESASVLREHKIGAMPVMDGEDLVGIVTSTDFLESLVTMTGVQSAFSATTRLEVEVENRPGALARLTAVVAERGVNILSILTHQQGVEMNEGMLSFVLRVDTIDGRGLADALRAQGFHILWPLEKAQRS